jgi:hypothetical protein
MRVCRNPCHNRESGDDASVWCCCANLRGVGLERFADDFEQRHHRNLVACVEQYGNDGLHVYAYSRTMCLDRNTDDNSEPNHDDANLYGRWANLLGRCVECASDYI